MEVFLLLASHIIKKFLLPKEPDDGTNDGIRQKSSARSDDLALLFMVEMRGIELFFIYILSFHQPSFFRNFVLFRFTTFQII